MTFEELLAEALALSREDRALLVRDLLDSLDVQAAADIDATTEQPVELDTRLNALDI